MKKTEEKNNKIKKEINNKGREGITLIALSVIIILLLSVLGITTYIANLNIKESQRNLAIQELRELQTVILQLNRDNQITQNSNNKYYGEKLDASSPDIIALREALVDETDHTAATLLNSNSNYYKINVYDLHSLDFENADEKINFDYIVNYETGEVARIDKSKRQVSISKRMYYYEDLFVYIPTAIGYQMQNLDNKNTDTTFNK